MGKLASSKPKKNADRGPGLAPALGKIRRIRPKVVAPNTVAKTTDSKGRVVLGGRFANRAVIVEQLSETEIIVKLARIIPEREAWLYDNAGALAAVRGGLAQARAGKVNDGPDVAADSDFAAGLED